VAEKPNKVEGAVFPFEIIEVLTVKVKAFVAVLLGEVESTTWAVKVNCPVCVVVPESKPLPAKVMPVGRVPDARLQR
jgi:hypothetical protein